MRVMSEYRTTMVGVLDQIVAEEAERIEAAAAFLVQAVEEDRLIHVFGAGGHSAIAAMDVFYRAGGLVNINALFPPGMNVVESHPTMARLHGTGPFICSYYEVKDGDPLIVVNFYGINPAGVEVRLEGKKRGARLITVNSHSFARQVPKSFRWRHESKKDLNDLAEVAIDNHVPYPDASLTIEGIEEPVCSTATIATCFTMNVLMTRTAELLVQRGNEPKVWMSNNIPGGDEHNEKYIEEYRHRIHHLYPVS